MIDVTQDIQSMTAFRRNSSGLMKRIKKTGRPLILTVKGMGRSVDEVFDGLDREISSEG